MSRLIVKSLPKKVTDKKLKELFSEKGEVTDVQLKYNSEGKFRCFAFVGFKTETEAAEAREYFNNTYIQNNKIKVEICKNERNNHKEENNQEKEEDQIRAVKEEFEELKEDAEFLEFLKVQRNVGDTKKIWSDDVVMSALAKKYLKKKQVNDEQENEKTDNAKDQKKDKTLPETIYQYTVAIRKIPKTHRNKKEIKEFFAPLKPISIRIPKIKCLAYVSFRTEFELKQALDKHKSFMGQNQVNLQVLKSKDSKATNIEFNSYKGRIEKNVPVENIEEYGRLFLRNLNYECTVENLEDLFKKYGPTTEISLPIDSLTQKIKGFAFVTFMFPEHAKQAFKELDRTIFQGRLLHIIPAEIKDNDRFNEFEDSSFKKRKNSQLKNESTKQTSNWNTLFLGQNAVANILSKKLNVEKSEFFKTSKNESLAARMALGETQLVNETRMFLEHNGVFLNSFNFENIKRSKTIFLIKHLPSNTSETELKEFLSTYGRIKRLILPPSCITAIVEMSNQQVAFDMFKKLAYKKFKNIPLYLEWAPINVLDKNVVDVVETCKESKTKKFKKLEYAIDEQIIDESEETKVDDRSTDEINKLSEETEIKENEIETKKDEEPKEDNRQKSYKILVKNVPFEATIKDIKELFGAFGVLQFVRLPKKLHGTGSHRGFAFVEYVNRNDAKKAFNSLSQSTHLYGRRLVLEYAKTEEDSPDDF